VHGAAWTLTVVAAALLAATITAHVREVRAKERDARAQARAKAIAAADSIEVELRRVMPVAATLAADLSDGRLAPRDIPGRLARDIAAHPETFEMGVAYTPYAADPKVKLFAPHIARTGDRPEPFQLEERYDYTTYDWYKDGLRGASWGEPYFGAATKTLVVGYNVPFSRPGDASRTPIGVARVNFSLDGIREMVSLVSLGQTGYGFLASRKGVYLSYPDENRVRQQVNALDRARAQGDTIRVHLLEEALAGRPSEAQTLAGATGQVTWLVEQPVPLPGWVFGIDFFADEVTLDPGQTRHGLVRILGAALLLAFALLVLFARVDRADHRDLWRASLGTGAILLAGICVMWALTIRYPDRNNEGSIHILDSSALQKFLHDNTPAGMPPTVQVPTGVIVRTVRFISANDVKITGTAWQQIPAEHRADVSPGLLMPDAESLTLRDAATEHRPDSDVASWTFEATLRESSSWSQKYPFDRALLRVRVTPKPSVTPVVLVPDLGAYPLLMPSAMPGVDGSIILPGWMLDHSYFSYVAQGLGTTDAAPGGLTGRLRDARASYDLAFNMVTQREFLDPFVSSVLPIIVIVSLLFGLLIVGSKKTERVAATGFKVTDILKAAVSLLFPALVAQVNLRSKVGASDIIYIEYFYFILYVAILAVAANALTFTLSGSGVSQVRDNLIPKLLFWPVVLGACLAVTLVFLF
jgi:hypothetical protein